MSVLNTLPAPVVQMGLVEKLVELEQNQPLVQQQMAQHIAREALQQQSRRVAETESASHGRKVRDREEERRRERRQPGRRMAPVEDDLEADADETAPVPEAPQPSPNPWAGKILNVKI